MEVLKVSVEADMTQDDRDASLHEASREGVSGRQRAEISGFSALRGRRDGVLGYAALLARKVYRSGGRGWMNQNRNWDSILGGIE